MKEDGVDEEHTASFQLDFWLGKEVCERDVETKREKIDR